MVAPFLQEQSPSTTSALSSRQLKHLPYSEQVLQLTEQAAQATTALMSVSKKPALHVQIPEDAEAWASEQAVQYEGEVQAAQGAVQAK